MRIQRSLSISLAALLLLGACGCRRPAGVGVIRGRVEYQGQRLNSGTITFLTADGNKCYAIIQKNGTYRIEDVPVGPVRVAVEVIHRPPFTEGRLRGPRQPPAPPRPAPPEEKPVVIPERYKDPDQSRLSCNVKKGEQYYDIRLDP